jgi:hypothetical protein
MVLDIGSSDEFCEQSLLAPVTALAQEINFFRLCMKA